MTMSDLTALVSFTEVLTALFTAAGVVVSVFVTLRGLRWLFAMIDGGSGGVSLDVPGDEGGAEAAMDDYVRDHPGVWVVDTDDPSWNDD